MKKQQGMTVIGMLFTVLVVVCGGILMMKIIPVYIEYYTIRQSISALTSIPSASLTGDPMMDVSVLRSSLNKHFDVNGIDELGDNQLQIIPEGTNQFKVKLKYQVTRPLVYNISIMFDFDETQEVKVGSD
ncbi:MAG: DUF4845 domain-containing protein [Legionellales bacterium]